jgi:hypothetical protein
MDLLGISAGGILYLGFLRRSYPPHRSIIIVLILALVAFSEPLRWCYVYQVRSNQFPLLFDPDNDFSKSLINGNKGSKLRHIDLSTLWTSDNYSDTDSCIYVSLVKGRWPSVEIPEPEPNWHGYETLEVSIYSDQLKELPLVLRVHDQKHNRKPSDRYNHRLLIQPGYNHFSLPLTEIAQAPETRTMDLGAISNVMLFSSHKHIGSGFCLLSLGLR